MSFENRWTIKVKIKNWKEQTHFPTSLNKTNIHLGSSVLFSISNLRDAADLATRQSGKPRDFSKNL